MHKFLIARCICDIFTICIAEHSLWALMYLKTKILNEVHLCSFLQLTRKIIVSVMWFFGFCIPAEICNTEVMVFGRFLNLAQILI